MNPVENISALRRILAFQRTQRCLSHPGCRWITGLIAGLWTHKINRPGLEKDKDEEEEDELGTAW